MNLNATQVRAYSLPREHREELLNNYEKWFDSIMTMPEHDKRTEYIFKLYNTFVIVNGEEDPSCWQCRCKLLSRFREYINVYKEHGIDRD